MKNGHLRAAILPKTILSTSHLVIPVLIALSLPACGGASPPPNDPAPDPSAPADPLIVQGATTLPDTAASDSAPSQAASASAPAARPSATAPAASDDDPEPPSGPSRANMHVGTMAVDGLTIEDLSCRADGLGLLGSVLVVGGIAKKKAALDACAPGGDRAHVEWAAAKGVVGKMKVKASKPAVEACVSKALTGTQAPFEGECSATIVLGK